jgi:hypothetical protein
VDAAKCGGCNNDGTISWQANTLSLDGTYTLSKITDTDTQCIWTNTSLDSSDWTEWSGTVCGGGANHDGTGSSSEIRVIYTKSSGKYTLIRVSHTTLLFGAVDFNWTGTSDLGDVVSNANGCNDSGILGSTGVALSNGGTATLALP